MKAKRNTFCLTVFTLIFSLMFSILPKTQAQVSVENQPDTIFSNTAPVTINTALTITAPTTANLYPSNISVSGMTGNTTRVQVSLARSVAYAPVRYGFSAGRSRRAKIYFSLGCRCRRAASLGTFNEARTADFKAWHTVC